MSAFLQEKPSDSLLGDVLTKHSSITLSTHPLMKVEEEFIKVVARGPEHYFITTEVKS